MGYKEDDTLSEAPRPEPVDMKKKMTRENKARLAAADPEKVAAAKGKRGKSNA